MSAKPSASSMQNFSLVRRLSQLGTRLFTAFSGVRVGRDQFGNVYYRERSTPRGLRERRWVMYAGEPEASLVPPEWHIWLHHMADAPIAENSALHKPWQQPYEANQSGTRAAYFPPSRGGDRPKATGDYQSWTPGE